MWKVLMVVVVMMVVGGVAEGQVRVRGYYRSNGTYVLPHYRSSPNRTAWDNWGTVGNVNPYTGSWGSRWPSYGRSSSYRSFEPYRPSMPYRPLYGGYGWEW